MISSWVLNFANSIVGVGVLAMPFCFQECGVILAGIMVLLSAFLTKSTCEFLLRGASNSRTTSYEQLALHLYGPVGKLVTELGTMGLLLGTLVAFQVVIGDLAPSVVHKFLGIEESWSLRTLMMAVSCLAMVPLCMMRNISSLSSFNAISMVFYSFFILVIVSLSLGNFISMKWIKEINFWRSAGFLHCLPIILLSFSCQTQVFAMYSALPDPNMMTMTQIINKAVDLVSIIYIVVGSFGYIAFYSVGVKGDLLHSFSHGLLTDGIKTGFWLSVIFSYPLMAFPVRAAINSLLFSKPSRKGIPHEVITTASDYISPDKFNYITIGVLSGTLVIGILIPNIETVLAITGALVGTFLCFIYPSALFLRSGASGRLKPFAQIVMICSILTMLASTTTVLSGMKNQPPEPLQTPHLHEAKTSLGQTHSLDNIKLTQTSVKEEKKEAPVIENPSPITDPVVEVQKQDEVSPRLKDPVVEIQKIENLSPKEIPSVADSGKKVEAASPVKDKVDIIQPEQNVVNVAESKVKELPVQPIKPVEPVVVQPLTKAVLPVVPVDQHLNSKRHIDEKLTKPETKVDGVGLHLLNVKSEVDGNPVVKDDPTIKDMPAKKEVTETKKESLEKVESVKPKDSVNAGVAKDKDKGDIEKVKSKPVAASIEEPKKVLDKESNKIESSKDNIEESTTVKRKEAEMKLVVPILRKDTVKEPQQVVSGKEHTEGKNVEKRDIHKSSNDNVAIDSKESKVEAVKSTSGTKVAKSTQPPVTHARLQRDILSKVEREM